MKTLAVCVVACLTASFSMAQGLGDAARKEQDRRQKGAAAGARTPAYGNSELLEAKEGKCTFSANVADTSGEPAGEPPADETAMPPAGIAENAGHVKPASEEPEQTNMDRYKATLAHWRGEFQPLKNRADALEKEIADPKVKAGRSSAVGRAPETPMRDAYGTIIGYQGGGGGSGPRPLHEGEAARIRLPKAREELAAVKQQLEYIEKQARADGFAPGQLY